ncbi:peroxidase-like [Anopheles ziemanni]|uniref:peroxidase-like n=1 Tax=Anopheles coustani TaxID=139045 RepID=UPI00265ACA2C|nr:peroxidase-like [Anopheles coustani]XP_058170552.1 peroxidase-like [Anopheles ziemanni]
MKSNGILILLVVTGLKEVLSQCNSLYRSFDGTCNNIQNPTWGTVNTPFSRLIPANYGDGKSSPPVAKDGTDLPNARLLSVEVFEEDVQNSPDFTLVNMQFGQIVAHDMALTRGVRDPITCCANGRLQPNPGSRCMAIPVSDRDPVFSAREIECLNMVRTITTCDLNTNCTQAEQINSVTSFLDLSVVYGNSVNESIQLRSLDSGLMKVEQRVGQEWPPRHPSASTTCSLRTPNEACYLTGDGRANQSPHLAMLQVTFVREHNRIARRLKTLNPTWDDEKLFQVARRINIAQYQHIVYYEWLPGLLGQNYMLNVGLQYQTTGFSNDYNPNVNPSVINSHTTAAFRFFHSSIQGILKFYEESRKSLTKVDINDHTNNPTILEQTSDRYPDLLRGMTTQPMGLNDISLDPATKHFLFRFNNMFGIDLKALDIQRGRDHGLPGYNDFANYCYKTRATNWDDFKLSLLPGAAQLLSIYYNSVDDLDLSVGLAFEKKIDGTQTGMLMRCILTEQFLRTRRGDRYFYENGQAAIGFTAVQLREIRKANIARILCDTSADVQQMQPAGFLLPSRTNPIGPCNALPTPDLKVFT